jgi:hypothetical protein
LIDEKGYVPTEQLLKREVLLKFLYDIHTSNLFDNDETFLLDYVSGFIRAGFWLRSSPTTFEKTLRLQYLSDYYYTLSGELELTKNSKHYAMLNPTIKYFLILKNNHDKMKYTVSSVDGRTFVTISVGIILKYFETYKKSIKKSIKAHTLILRFIKNTIIKLVRQDGYVFLLRGVNLRLFKLINFFNFCQKKSRMVLYVLQPQQRNKIDIGKKIKSIKRKLQKKNLIRVNKNYKMSRNINKENFFV